MRSRLEAWLRTYSGDEAATVLEWRRDEDWHDRGWVLWFTPAADRERYVITAWVDRDEQGFEDRQGVSFDDLEEAARWYKAA